MTLAVLMSITVALVSATAGSAERNGGITRIRLSHGNNNGKGNVELIRGSKSKTIVDYHTILHDVIFVSYKRKIDIFKIHLIIVILGTYYRC